jgi:rSAM/selenodomain-associated transferase 2
LPSDQPNSDGGSIAVIVPMLNEERAIAATLDAIRLGAPDAQIIVADGGSIDRGVEIARPRCDLLIEAARGRARQMNAGAAAAGRGVLAFVHADTIVPSTFGRDIEQALADPAVAGGRFDLMLDDNALACRIIGAHINLRSRLMRSATGDQAIFVRRDVFERLGGFADIELCEDVDLARRLKRAGRIACLRSRVITSARRWRKDGVVRTVLRMWLIKSLFLAGVPPARLHRYYADTR